MARVTAGGCSAAQISPEISDDEVFSSESVWRPLRTNGHPTTVPQQTWDLQLQEVQLERSEQSDDVFTSSDGQYGQHFGFRDQNRSSEQEEPSWNASLSSFSTSGNTNNNRPGGLCSVQQDALSEDVELWSERRRSESSESERRQSESTELLLHRPHLQRLERHRQSIVDGLLFEIYDRWHGGRADSFDSDTFTECSSLSEALHTRWDSYYDTAAEQRHVKQFSRSFLENQSLAQLKKMVSELQRTANQTSTRLVRQLKRRDRRLAKLSRNCDVVTAVLQAASLKRQIDTRMKFSLEPPPGQSAFDQWKDAMKAVNRLPMGIPTEFRKKVWLSLADHYIRKLKIDWHKTVRLAFNERSNPDDDKLGMQIVKDLHRTGCSSFSGQDNEEDRAVLKRVLLAYARWNKRIGYCQGFNVIAALLLNVMERKEDDALKVMIFLIDSVLPESYFDNNLRALSVDMAVFRDLLRMTLPTLSRHLDRLQHAAQDVNTGACYEPPLTNVFTMQWFLTIFATCLPKEVVLRVWDAIFLEGSEVLLRTALCLWGKLARRMMKVDSADEFYSLMGELSSDMMEGTVFNSDDMIKAIYAIAPFPFPQLSELREKYTYNIRPFSSQPAPSRKSSRVAKAVLYSDEDELDEDELRAIASFPGMAVQGAKGKGVDISLVGPGAYGAECDLSAGSRDAVYMERMSTDMTALKMQYDKLRQRQKQAHILIAAAASAKKAVQIKQKTQAPVLVPKIESPLAMNHLFVGKVQGGRNRLVTDGPRIAGAGTWAPRNSLLTKQLQAVAAAQAASRSKRSPAKNTPSTPRGAPVQAASASASASASSVSAHQLSASTHQLSASAHQLSVSTHQLSATTTERGGLDSVGGEALEVETTPALRGVEKEEEEERIGMINKGVPDGRESNADTLELDNADVSSMSEEVVVEMKVSSPSAPPQQGRWEGEGEGEGEGKEDPAGLDSRLALPGTTEEDGQSTCSESDLHDHAASLSLDPDLLAFSRVQSCPQTLDTFPQGRRGEDHSGGVGVATPSLDDASSCQSSPREKNRAQRPTSFQVCVGRSAGSPGEEEERGSGGGGYFGGQVLNDGGDTERHSRVTARSLSVPNGVGFPHVAGKATLTPSPTPTHGGHPPPTSSSSSLSAASTPTNIAVTPQFVSSSSSPSPSHPPPPPLSTSPVKTNSRPFNPFPVKHVNTNRAKTGLKLGLYTPSTLEQILGKKARNASS